MTRSLSVFYIVRNEQDRIAKSIKSIESIANEIVVVDTGSVDRTIEVCNTFKAKVYKYKWDSDFSGARNFALEKCTKDFVMYLDADEVLAKQSVGEISKILSLSSNSKNLACYVKITSCRKSEKTGELVPIGTDMHKSPQIRLFYRDKSVKFKGLAGESVEESLYRNSKCVIVNSEIEIMHDFSDGRNEDYLSKKEEYHKKISGGNSNMIAKNVIDQKSEDGKKSCAIIICVYNLIHATKKCIDSVISSTKYPYKIILVDDGSSDNCSSYLKSIKNSKYIRMDSNSGVAKSRNRATRVAARDENIGYICFLDNDTEVYDGWLTKLISSIDSGECDIVGPITNSAVGSQRLVKNNWVGRYGPEKILEMVNGKETKGRHIHTDFINRFCQVFSISMLKEVGLLDESFGKIGWEDNDFCRRFTERGLKIAVNKDVFIFHSGHSTSAFNNQNYFTEIQNPAKEYHKKWKTNFDGSWNPSLKQSVGEGGFRNPFTSIVVLTYNNFEINKKFFEAMRTGTQNYELIVVDNGSTDGTVEYLKTIKDIKLSLQNKNLGVIKGRNIGINMSSGEYIVCLDNDQIVHKDWLVDLHSKMAEGYDFVGVEAWEVNSSYCPIKRHNKFNMNLKIDYVGAGGCLMKRSVLEKIGIYDERFGMAYFEDVDICYRARKSGYKIGWCYKNIINHLEHSTLIKGQKEFNYNEALANSHRKFLDKMKAIKEGTVFDEIMISKKRKVTFCMALKSRSERATASIKSIINQKGSEEIDFCIIEDESEDMLCLDKIDGSEKIRHIIVDTGFAWNKSLLINQLANSLLSECICFWDADFIYSENFLEEYFKLIRETNFEKEYLQIMVTESCDSNKKGEIIPGGTLWGGFYTYKTDHFIGINGFDESFVGWGYEDIDFNTRIINAYKICPKIIKQKNFVYHNSHDDVLRHMSHMHSNKKRYDDNKKIGASKTMPPTILKHKWRSNKMEIGASETIAIICNGPSLRGVDLFSLKEKDIDCFTMNMSFRQWYKNGFWSKYWGCFDYVVTDNHSGEFKRFIEDPKVPIESFFLLRKVSDSKKLHTLSFKTRELYKVGNTFENFGDVGNTGCNCCQVALCLGYKKIILLGADCNYVDFVDGAKRVGNKLVMERTPKTNPNYAWDDYNQKNDEYNVPAADKFQMPGWKALSDYCNDNGIQVVNCSMQSKIEYFRKNTLERELTLY